ncbi:MAG TPA: helix-turn-helix domain-containing protein [Miltoncostaea sp.]|jgi:predicted ArsR family transcriptional regulator|nr:helix-turn-helix domain-containing protein [Miltoncostaea sp.]
METTRAGDGTRGTRRAILELLGGSSEGMTAAELGRALGMHPNGVRKQLEALARDGSVGAEREVSGRRGRPAIRYRAADERRETAAAQRLAALLVELVAEMGPDEASVEEFGRRQAAQLAASPDGRAALMHMLTTMGFAPRETTGAAAWRDGRLEVVLGRCPFAGAVRADGGRLVCVLHRGLSRGLVELDDGGRLTGFVAEAPERAGCRIAAEGLARHTGP